MFKHGGVGILVPNTLSSAASIVAFERERLRLLIVTLFPEKAERDAALLCRAEDVPGLLFRQNILMMHLWLIYL